MPVFNCQDTISLAIRSILGQTYNNWELLIVDDGSTDKTPAIVEQFSDPRIHIWNNSTNLGLSIRLNHTINQSRGIYYARMDGDDIAYPQRLECQIAYMETHPEIDLIGTWMLVFGTDGIPHGIIRGAINPKNQYFLRAVPIRHPTFFGRMDWFRKNMYSTWAKHFEDQDLLLRGLRNSKFNVVPMTLVGYREENLSIAKQIKYRISYLESFQHLCKEFGWYHSLLLVVSQIAKMGIDIFAIGTGLNYRILKQRFKPVSKTEQSEWEEIWLIVNSENDMRAKVMR